MIKKVTIKNFKSIISANIMLPDMGAIVGVNAAGKSNFVNAIRFVADLVKGKSLNDAAQEQSLIPEELLPFDLQEAKTEIEVTFIDKKDEISYLVALEIKKNTLVISNERLTIRNNDNVVEQIYVRVGNDITRKNNTTGLEVTSDTLFLPILNNVTAKKAREFFKQMRFIDFERSSLRKLFPDPKDERDENPHLLYLLQTERPESFEQLIALISKIIPSIKKIDSINIPSKINREAKPYVTFFKEATLQHFLSIKSISMGDLKLIYLLAGIIALHEGGTLFIEEIENSFQPGRLRALMDNLENIAKIEGKQVLLTTHSPFVLDHFKPADLVFVSKKDNGTKLYNLSTLEHSARVSKLLTDTDITTSELLTYIDF